MIMKIILLEDVEKLGKSGDSTTVANGYARNFLIPKGFAIEDNRSNRRIFDHLRKQLSAKKSRSVREAQDLADMLKGVAVEIPVLTGEEDRIFGAVTAKNITDALAAKGIKVDRRHVELHDPIKALGIYDVSIKLYTDIHAIVKVSVSKKNV
jgi:large subunit ribosomal protein L9